MLLRLNLSGRCLIVTRTWVVPRRCQVVSRDGCWKSSYQPFYTELATQLLLSWQTSTTGRSCCSSTP